MIKYLDLFEKDMKKHNADYFVEQIQLYKIFIFQLMKMSTLLGMLT